MSDIQMPAAGRVKVKRDGPRGWHWITAASFDSTKHELIDPPAPTAAPAPGTPRRGRLPKQQPTEATNGDR